MEDYNKIIESLGVRFIKAKKINVVQPVIIENFYDVENTVIMVTSGAVGFGKNGREVYAQEGTLPIFGYSLNARSTRKCI